MFGCRAPVVCASAALRAPLGGKQRVDIYIYIYIYMYRERERERERDIVILILIMRGIAPKFGSQEFSAQYQFRGLGGTGSLLLICNAKSSKGWARYDAKLVL